MGLSAELQNELNLIVNGKKPSKESISLISSYNFKIFKLQRSRQEKNKAVTTALDEIGGANILLNCMKLLSNNVSRNNTGEECYSSCYQVLRSLCVNASDISLEFCDQCGECGLLSFLANELRNLKDKFTEDPKIFYDLVDDEFIILMNCSKSANNTQILQNLDVVPLATEYLEIIQSRKHTSPISQIDANNDITGKDNNGVGRFLYATHVSSGPHRLQYLTELKMDCLILLAYTMDEEDFHQMGDLNDVIEYLVQNLDVALSEPDHTSSGYDADELISAIQTFTNNEENGLKIVAEFNEFGIFSIISEKGFSFKREEKISILSLLCRLSFIAKLKEKITKNRTLMQFLQKTTREESNRNNKEKQMAKLILFVLGSDTKKLPDLSQGASSAPTTSRRTEKIKKVVLSFENQSQILAEQIKSDLISKFPAYDVYLEGDDDYSDESLSANEIKTFQQSDASLLLLTKRYQNSLHCRAVAEFLTSSTTRKKILLFEKPSLMSSSWIKSILDYSENLDCIEMKELFNYKVKSQIQKSLSGTVQKHIEQPIGDDETNLSDNSDEFEDDDSGGSLSDNHCDRFAHHDTKNLSTDLQNISLNKSCPSTSHVKQSNTSVEKHIMISYQHSYRNVADQIRNLLRESGFKVWMDKYDMKGDTTNAMMDAIENSEFFIMCWSEEYEMSYVCKKEAEYADNALSRNRLIPIIVEREYRPKSWIAFHFRSLVYYKISSGFDAKIHSKIVRLLENERQEDFKTSSK